MSNDSIKIYFTKRVMDEIGAPIAFTIIKGVEMMNIKRDYLQIFKLDVIGNSLIVIEHSQEQPQWNTVYYMDTEGIEVKEDISGMKLYMIIEDTYATLMLAEEY